MADKEEVAGGHTILSRASGPDLLLLERACGDAPSSRVAGLWRHMACRRKRRSSRFCIGTTPRKPLRG